MLDFIRLMSAGLMPKDILKHSVFRVCCLYSSGSLKHALIHVAFKIRIDFFKLSSLISASCNLNKESPLSARCSH